MDDFKQRLIVKIEKRWLYWHHKQTAAAKKGGQTAVKKQIKKRDTGYRERRMEISKRLRYSLFRLREQTDGIGW